MDQVAFFQTVAAVFLANVLFALSAFMFWRVNQGERGKMAQAGFWVFAAGLVGPAILIVTLYNLP